MINGYTLVGRIIYMGKDYLVLSVGRSTKNQDGEYDYDKFNIYMSDNILTNTKAYCHVGDVIGVKGTMQSVEYEVDSKVYRKLKLLADKVTFLSSSTTNKSGIMGNMQDIEEGTYETCD